MSVSRETEALLWEAMLDADMSRRYYIRLAGWLTRVETGLSILTAVLSSGAFLTLVLSGALQDYAKWFALGATISSTWLVFSKHGKRSELAAKRARHWMEAQSKLERLWARRLQITDAEINKALERLNKETVSGVETIIQELPLNNRIRNGAYREVLEARGLAHG